MISPSTNEEMNALAYYFDQWRRGGVTRFWLGYSNTFARNSGRLGVSYSLFHMNNMAIFFWFF